MKGAVLFATTQENTDRWTAELLRHEPSLDLRIWPDTGHAEDIQYAVVARPPKGELAKCSNLKAIFSMWAGVEDLISDPDIEHVPIYRMVEPGLTDGIVLYVIHHVIGVHIGTSFYNSKDWYHPFHKAFKVAQQTTVGVLGLGSLGIPCATALTQLNFRVVGFSSRRKEVPDVTSYCGESELEEFLSQSEILVSILPRTQHTENFVNKNTLGMLPSGASLINCGRGETINDEDLLHSVRNGHIANAILDVFREEPLPANHPFWAEPNITVTPHCASKPNPDTASQVILEKMRAFENNEPIAGVVDRSRAY